MQTLRQFLNYGQYTKTADAPKETVFQATAPNRQSWMDEVLDVPYAEAFQSLYDTKK